MVAAAAAALARLGRHRLHHAGNRPDMTRQFARHRRQRDVMRLAAAAQIAQAPTQPGLRLPGLVADRLRQVG